MAESRVPVSIYSKFFFILDLTVIISKLSFLRIVYCATHTHLFFFLNYVSCYYGKYNAGQGWCHKF